MFSALNDYPNSVGLPNMFRNNFAFLCLLYKFKAAIRLAELNMLIQQRCILYVGRRGSVVACAAYKREIAGSIPGCAECAPRLCS